MVNKSSIIINTVETLLSPPPPTLMLLTPYSSYLFSVKVPYLRLVVYCLLQVMLSIGRACHHTDVFLVGNYPIFVMVELTTASSYIYSPQTCCTLNT